MSYIWPTFTVNSFTYPNLSILYHLIFRDDSKASNIISDVLILQTLQMKNFYSIGIMSRQEHFR